jgi:hypothetical protein
MHKSGKQIDVLGVKYSGIGIWNRKLEFLGKLSINSPFLSLVVDSLIRCFHGHDHGRLDR